MVSKKKSVVPQHSEKKTLKTLIRVTESEKHKFKLAAKADGRSVSSFMVHAANERAERLLNKVA
jgi:uncharacterized protein (DUF1778 family)